MIIFVIGCKMHKKTEKTGGKKKVIIDAIDSVGIKLHYQARGSGKKPTKCRRVK